MHPRRDVAVHFFCRPRPAPFSAGLGDGVFGGTGGLRTCHARLAARDRIPVPLSRRTSPCGGTANYLNPTASGHGYRPKSRRKRRDMLQSPCPAAYVRRSGPCPAAYVGRSGRPVPLLTSAAAGGRSCCLRPENLPTRRPRCIFFATFAGIL